MLRGIPLLMVARTGLPFTPTDISGLLIWLKADAITGLNDGDPIATWTDSSGTSNNATATSSHEATYKTNIINGLPVARFDGTNDFFIITNPMSATLPYTVFIVYKKRTTGVAFPTFTSSPTTDLYTWMDFTDGNAYMLRTGTTFFQGTGNQTSFCLISEVATVADEKVWKNGITMSLISGAFTGVSGSFDRLGVRGPAGTNWADGDLAEILFYNSDLSDTDRVKVENYLIAKYAL